MLDASSRGYSLIVAPADSPQTPFSVLNSVLPCFYYSYIQMEEENSNATWIEDYINSVEKAVSVMTDNLMTICKMLKNNKAVASDQTKGSLS